MGYKDMLIHAIENSPTKSITLQVARNLLGSDNVFYTIKSQINNNRGKYKLKQIIKEGKKGNSVWKMAGTSPSSTIAYGTKRAAKSIRNLSSRHFEALIAISSEKNFKVKQMLMNTLTQEHKELMQVIPNII